METRRDFIIGTIGVAASISNGSGQSLVPETAASSYLPSVKTKGRQMQDHAEDPRITRARLSGPEQVTRDATVAELLADGTLDVLAKGTNEWICVPGDENKIGEPPMCMNPMGLRWMTDAMQGKPKPTNESPGVIYMLCGATQRSNTDPSDRTSPAIPIGPHWMITWPFDAEKSGLPTTLRDKGAWVMFAGTPFAYLHVCGTPWDGNEFNEGDKAVWTMSYAPPQKIKKNRQSQNP